MRCRQQLVAILERAFATPLSRRQFYGSDLFLSTQTELKTHIRHAAAFAVSGVYTYVRNMEVTVAVLHGSRPAELTEAPEAGNQVADEVKQLLFTGKSNPWNVTAPIRALPNQLAALESW